MGELRSYKGGPVSAQVTSASHPVLQSNLVDCQRNSLHLGSDHREAAPGLASARRLDGGVERGQVGLSCDRVNQLDDIADPRGGLGELGDVVVGLARLRQLLAGDAGGVLNPAADLVDRRAHLLGRPSAGSMMPPMIHIAAARRSPAKSRRWPPGATAFRQTAGTSCRPVGKYQMEVRRERP